MTTSSVKSLERVVVRRTEKGSATWNPAPARHARQDEKAARGRPALTANTCLRLVVRAVSILTADNLPHGGQAHQSSRQGGSQAQGERAAAVLNNTPRLAGRVIKNAGIGMTASGNTHRDSGQSGSHTRGGSPNSMLKSGTSKSTKNANC